jgi:flagellar biogenesis protein FliO
MAENSEELKTDTLAKSNRLTAESRPPSGTSRIHVEKSASHHLSQNEKIMIIPVRNTYLRIPH